MPAKRKLAKSLADSIEECHVIEGDVERLLPFYKLGTVYQPEKISKSDARTDPCGIPIFDKKAFENHHGSKVEDAVSTVSVRDPSKNPYAGLANVGNTCYVNSLLQYLFVNVAFRRCILAQQTTADKVLLSLQKLFGLMQQTSDHVCDPGHFVDCAGITRGVQEDVTEFWNMLIDHLTKHTYGSIRNLVAFKQASIVHCSGCQSQSIRDELLFELHVKPPADLNSGRVKRDTNLTGWWLMTSTQTNRTFQYEWVHTPGACSFSGDLLHDPCGTHLPREAIQSGRVEDDMVSWKIGEVRCAARLSDDGLELVDGLYGPLLTESAQTTAFKGRKMAQDLKDKFIATWTRYLTEDSDAKIQSGMSASDVELRFEVLLQEPQNEAQQRLPSVYIEEALNSNFIAETLSGENAYHCEKCGFHQDATRKNSLQSLPPFLHIVFDRFSWDAASDQRKRVCCEVVFPEKLSLSNFISNSGVSPNPLDSQASFELIGVLKHHSTTAESGHYTATLRQPHLGTDTEAVGAPRWWQFNDTRVSEDVSPGDLVGIAPGVSRLWSSKSAYMLIYRSLGHRPEHAYAESGPIALPKGVAEDVERITRERQSFMEESEKHFMAYERLVAQRSTHADMIWQQFSMAGDSSSVPMPKPTELSVIPRQWLDYWNLGTEADPKNGCLSTIHYSQVLLPDTGSVKRSLNPFAMWDGRAKVMPTSLFKTGFLECFGARDVGQTRILPSELSIDDTSLAALACPKVAKTLQRLMKCTREIFQLLLKLRAERDVDSARSIVWIYKPRITDILKGYSKLGPLPPENSKRRFDISGTMLWEQLALEWHRYEKKSHALDSSGKNGSAVEVPELAGPLRCPHGQLKPGLRAIVKASQVDIDRLLKLEEERCNLWKDFGARGISPRLAQGKLPLGTAIECNHCKEAKQNLEAAKRATLVRKKALESKFPALFKGRLPIVDRNTAYRKLQVGSFFLIPADWRTRWLSYVDSCNGAEPPALDPSTLRCKHHKLRYDPAGYFKESHDALSGKIKDRHPHEAAYILVPQREAEEIYRSYGKSPSEVDSAKWCSMECQKISSEVSIGERMFVCSPGVCELCTGPDGEYLLTVRLVTDMELQTLSSIDIAASREVKVHGAISGQELKDMLIKEYGFKEVISGQLLLSLDGSSFGDADTLLHVLGSKSFLRSASLTVEIYDFVMSEPAPKRHRSSLLNSNLAGNHGL